MTTEISRFEHEGYTITGHDPYGFFKVHSNGFTPQELEGVFTSLSDATKAVDAFLRRKSHEEESKGVIAKEYHNKLLSVDSTPAKEKIKRV